MKFFILIFYYFTIIFNNCKKIYDLGNQLNKLSNQMKLIKYKNLRWINKEVNIGFDPEFLFRKKMEIIF